MPPHNLKPSETTKNLSEKKCMPYKRTENQPFSLFHLTKTTLDDEHTEVAFCIKTAER